MNTHFRLRGLGFVALLSAAGTAPVNSAIILQDSAFLVDSGVPVAVGSPAPGNTLAPGFAFTGNGALFVSVFNTPVTAPGGSPDSGTITINGGTTLQANSVVSRFVPGGPAAAAPWTIIA